jgi:hypothetical protein
MEICSGCGSITGPKGREGLGVEQGCCSACGADHKRERRNRSAEIRSG